jgi:S1-C subfamily serine protease
VVCCLFAKVKKPAQFEITGGSMDWIGLVVFISVMAYIVRQAGTVKLKPAQLLPIAFLFIFSATNTWAIDWSAGAMGALDALRDQLAQERKMEQQKQLIDYQYKLESERIERTYQLERERTERERAEQERRQEVVRRQQKIAEDKKLQEVAETKRNAISTGTGFFIAPGGYLVTNHHVIEDATDYAVRDHKGRFYKATVIARDSNRDLALLKVNGAFPTLKIASSESVSKGQRVLAVGYPQISIQGNESKVTDGIISSFSGLQNDDNWFQISVPIQGGNSGGPLVTESGGVVGVVVATANVARFYKLTGNLPQNVNYAIKSKVLLDFLRAQDLQNFAASKGKISIDDVDASTVLVIAKNGLIDVSYTVSAEQRAQEVRERTRIVAEEERRQREEKLAEQNRVANSQRLEVPSRLPLCMEYRHNCYGEMTSPNGQKYVGEFKDNKSNGQGKATHPNGITYVGHFKDNLPNGQGIITSPNGVKYVGEFKDGKFNGQGTHTRPNGSNYVGEFKDNKYNGQGTFNFSNGDKYVGEFKDGVRNGRGTLTFASGDTSTGVWESGNLVRAE